MQGRRESTTEILAKIIPLHAPSSTRCKITQKRLRKEQTTRVPLTTDNQPIKRLFLLSQSAVFALNAAYCSVYAAPRVRLPQVIGAV